MITRDDNTSSEKKANIVNKNKSQKIQEINLTSIQQSIVDEDENRIVRNKPAHMLIHPGDKHTTDVTLHDMMISYLNQTQQNDASQTFTPSFCYRLDKNTSGICISAKTYAALQYLNELIRERKTTKTYHAIVVWTTPSELVMKEPLFVWYNRNLGKSQCFVNQEKGKESHTHLYTLESIVDPDLWELSLVEVQLHTGRMHQIRVHCAHHGYPVLWDLMYGIPASNRIASKKKSITRQLLHASRYWFYDRFAHKERTFKTYLPDDFTKLFAQAKSYV